MQPKLTFVRPEDAYILYLEYDSGDACRFDVRPYINGTWYGELRELCYFNIVRLLSGGIDIEWSRGRDIALHELYELGEPVDVGV